jgi:DNA-directed RNA polymerase specialized sigma24 family protein/ferric-dicitrate binding protein FerR (iron transport regulator)
LSLAGSELARAIYRTANTLLASSADAEEVTLDVLVSLRKKLAEVGQDGLAAWLPSLPGWLDRAAVNKAKGRAAKQKHHSSTLTELAMLAEQVAGSESRPSVAALLVREVLAYFPRRHRFVFVLKYGLGHTDDAIAELTGLDTATVARTLSGVAHKLREYGSEQPMPRAMLEGMAPGLEDNPLRHYVEVYGRPDEVTEARIQRRFETWLRDGPSQELSSDDHSFHDQSFSGAGLRVADVMAAVAAATAGAEQELGAEPGPDPEPDVEPPLDESFRDSFRREPRGPWVLATVAWLAVLGLAFVQWRTSLELERLADGLATLEHGGVAKTAEKGPVLLEPGTSVELAHNGRAEPSKDATIERLRDDPGGAEFRLTAGSIALHVKPAKGVAWIVHDGRYDISTSGARFRVTHTSSVPEIEVFEGNVHVTGGLLGTDGVDVTTADYSLAAVIRARGEVPIAELVSPATVDPKQLQALATDEVYGRALSLRSSDETGAKALLQEIVARGSDDWVSELAFEQLRTLVAPGERLVLQVAYAERFPDGQFAEAFAAIVCQEAPQDEAGACWTEFALTYPSSLFGP